jgi:hypothetical protein
LPEINEGFEDMAKPDSQSTFESIDDDSEISVKLNVGNLLNTLKYIVK